MSMASKGRGSGIVFIFFCRNLLRNRKCLGTYICGIYYVHLHTNRAFSCIHCPLYYSIGYKTQIVGGVVHRIPITSGACIDVGSLCMHVYAFVFASYVYVAVCRDLLLANL